MKTAGRRHGRVVGTVVVLLAAALVLGTLQASGFWDESKAVRIEAGEIENSTLAIGTHLIHLSISKLVHS